jgi:general stress protein 26
VEQQDLREKAVSVVREFDTAMLVTHMPTQNTLRSRPMAIGAVEDDGTIWFVTTRDSPKVAELEAETAVNVAMQSRTTFASLSGAARPVDDRVRVRSMWREPWRVWFPDGPDQADLVLLRVDPRVAEFWDQGGSRGLRYAWEAVKAYASGERIDEGAQEGDAHGKVDL